MNEECEACLRACLPSNPRSITVDPLFKRRYPHVYPKYLRPLCESCPNYSGEQPEEPEPKVGGKRYIYMRLDRTSFELDSQIAVLRGQLQRMTKDLNFLIELNKKKQPKEKPKGISYKGIK